MIDLSISIVNTNNKKLLKNCLDSIYTNTRTISFEIFVIDNACTDGSSEMVRQNFPQVNLILNKNRLNFSINHNQAIKKSTGRYVLILNEDTVILPQALDHLVAFMDEQPLAGMAGPKLIMPDGAIQPSCFEFPSLYRAVVWYIRVNTGSSSAYFPLTNSLQPIEVECISGACVIVRRKAIAEVGLLDELYFMGGQDLDWCHRMKKSRWLTFYVPKAEIIHFINQTESRLPLLRDVERRKSLVLYLLKHRGWIEALLLAVMTEINTLLRALWNLRHGDIHHWKLLFLYHQGVCQILSRRFGKVGKKYA